MLESFIAALTVVFTVETIGWIVLGIIVGIIVGATPGIGSGLGMALLLPLTIPLSGLNAFIFLVSIYSGGQYGGSISAILMNTPGTSAAAATTLDGYPMSRTGKSMTALSISAVSSALSGFMTIGILILITPIVVWIVLQFGSPEYFLIALLGIAMIAIVTQGSIVKGILGGAFGLLLTTIGFAPTVPTVRYGFGQTGLYDGISFIAALIGLFALAEMFRLASESGGISQSDVDITGSMTEGFTEVFSRPFLFLKSSMIGMGVGAVPGAGSTISTFVAYGEAVRTSKNPETFGSGNPEGLIAAESANNSTVAGSLLPTLSFGIPGGGAAAVLLGGLIMHGLRPGPQLFTTELVFTYSAFIALLIGNIVILVVGLLFIRRLGIITKVDADLIIPMIIVLGVLGGLGLRFNWFDVLTVLVLGIMGYYMKKYDYSVITFVLGVVLGPIAEENLVRSLTLSRGSVMIFFSRPLSVLIILAMLLLLFGPFIKASLARRRT